jgi:hypothetical protein
VVCCGKKKSEKEIRAIIAKAIEKIISLDNDFKNVFLIFSFDTKGYENKKTSQE